MLIESVHDFLKFQFCLFESREPSLVKGILKLFEGDKIVAEGAGAAGVAALIEGLLSDYMGKT